MAEKGVEEQVLAMERLRNEQARAEAQQKAGKKA